MVNQHLPLPRNYLERLNSHSNLNEYKRSFDTPCINYKTSNFYLTLLNQIVIVSIEILALIYKAI